MERWVKQRCHEYVRHGGKVARRNMVKRLITALEDIAANEHGVKQPPQVGRAHIHRYYNRRDDLSEATLRDHFYAFSLLWKLLGRAGEPPKP
ncbi:hypothetical protein QUN95_003066 [Vibrio parahaemolyticus]|uniref:hypothetical protein n=1 Tax=Vibrio parahaemolyticus TaxID=670 RepID=UPI001869E7AD|nr:hypothetical protein [Vibrio parahaemolyticus]EHK9070989.1 hypothetical protein [Vibrio parahaemolyticus]EIU6790542.1 hypothetical protein [Vibrio parahaemolyticus]EIY6180889.1 hypothetical protein [Vibrio parahaemolyticus]EIZ1175139.1 hypothetical protein [Vibrio parahaemolyticus]EJE8529116.1 hypothetical protein [Vibrio parahaemolyticus]